MEGSTYMMQQCPTCNFIGGRTSLLKSLKYAVCDACDEGVANLITLINTQLHAKGDDELPRNNSKRFANALKWVNEVKEREQELNEKLGFLYSFASTLADQIHTDIQIKPGNSGCPIPAHRALLACRSSIFKNMLELDGYITPAQDTLTLPDMNYEELESFLEFLYSGNLSKEKMEKHVYSLTIAADKYEISYLQKICDKQMRTSLNVSNALDVLDIADTCSNQSLKDLALNFVVKHMGEIVFSAKFDDFALKNPHLNVQITRASLEDKKSYTLV